MNNKMMIKHFRFLNPNKNKEQYVKKLKKYF